MTNQDLINHIESFARSSGLAPATITSRAVGNSRLYANLLNGKSCTLDTANEIVGFIEKHGEKS